MEKKNLKTIRENVIICHSHSRHSALSLCLGATAGVLNAESNRSTPTERKSPKHILSRIIIVTEAMYSAHSQHFVINTTPNYFCLFCSKKAISKVFMTM